MSGLDLIFFAAAGAALVGWAAFVYRRREMPGRGRTLLAGLRAAALLLLLLVLFDPELPARGGAGRESVVLLDGSLSMSLPRGSGAGTRWDAARTEAVRRAGERPVIVFGSAARAVPANELAALSPDAPVARVLPALRAAAEAGARHAVILTDGGLADAREAGTWLPSLGMEVEVRVIGGDAPPNRALVEVAAPAWAESGRPVTVGFAVGRSGLAGAGDADSVTVTVLQDGQPLGSARVAVPPVGRLSSGEVAVTPVPPSGGGQVRLDLVMEPGDAVPDDDRRTAYVFVTDQPAGVAVVSFSPDWEPRFLQPVLTQALGLPVRGFLRVAGETPYRASGVGLEAGATATEDEVRRAAARADLIVLHGYDDTAPGWARELVGQHARVLILAGGAGGVPGLPVAPGPAVPDEWYASAELPASPVAPLLAGAETDEAPPLTMLRPTSPPAGSWTPLNVTRGVRGAAAPAAVGGESDGRRWVVATGQGYWRWSFRGETSRQLYARFWGALTGWLVRDGPLADGAELRPSTHVVARGGSIGWRLGGRTVDSVAVSLTPLDGGAAADTVLTPQGGDSVAHAAPAPGRYTYEVTAFAEGAATAQGSGELTVESFSAEFSRPAGDLGMLTGGVRAVGGQRAGPGRPLHATPLPYILIITIVALEWVLRRRWGLR